MFSNRMLLFVTFAFLAVGSVGCGDSPSTLGTDLKNGGFMPSEFRARRGDTIVFQNVDFAQARFTSVNPAELFDSGLVAKLGAFQWKVESPKLDGNVMQITFWDQVSAHTGSIVLF